MAKAYFNTEGFITQINYIYNYSLQYNRCI